MAEGPDRVIPSNKFTTWDQDGATQIIRGTDWPNNLEPVSLVTLIDQTCQSAGSKRIAYKQKVDGKWVSTNYEQYFKQIQCVAKGFLELGLEPQQSVAIFGFNSPEWFLSEMSCVYAGGIVAGLYPTNTMETNKHILKDCEANILVVEDAKLAQQYWEVKNELPHLKKIVQWSGTPPNLSDVISWKQLMAIGEEAEDEQLKQRQKNIAINQCCLLIYTSGTTGMPKGAMLSHDNIRFSSSIGARDISIKEGDVMVSYLPLSHVSPNLLDIWIPFLNKATVAFADKMALKGTLLNTLQEARPSIFLGVPRVWEKIQEGMQTKAKDVKGLKKAVSTACKKAGLKYHLEGKDSIMYTVGKKAVYSKVKEALGLDQCHCFISGGAPMNPETFKYFISLDIHIGQVYGLSETGGGHTRHFGPNVNIATVGRTLPGCKTRIIEKDPDGNGEICMWGRHIMMGYLNREDKTTEDVDSEGWFHSGDVGSIDEEGYLYITGRKKELLITAGGENVAPVPIESHVKDELPCISNCILIGDKRKFLTVFLTFQAIMDESNAPTNKLTPLAVDWCKSVGCNATTIDKILGGPDNRVMEAIQAGIDRANKKAVSRAAMVQKWTILPLDISIPTGELGPTLKLKRFYFNKKYAKTIDQLYT